MTSQVVADATTRGETGGIACKIDEAFISPSAKSETRKKNANKSGPTAALNVTFYCNERRKYYF